MRREEACLRIESGLVWARVWRGVLFERSLSPHAEKKAVEMHGLR